MFQYPDSVKNRDLPVTGEICFQLGAMEPHTDERMHVIMRVAILYKKKMVC